MINTFVRLVAAISPNTGHDCTFPHGLNDLFGFPHWYDYVGGVTEATGACQPKVDGLTDIYLIGAAILDIMVHVAALLAVGFVIYGGVSYILSQGEPDKTSKARHTIMNALIGLAISISASAIITFLAGRIN